MSAFGTTLPGFEDITARAVNVTIGLQQTENAVAAPTMAVTAHRGAWRLSDDLCGGTEGVRDERYLPRWPGEALPAYEARLRTAFLFEAYAHAISTVAARPFSKPVTVDPPPPESLEPLLESADGMGTSFHDFAYDVFEASVKYGVTAVLTNYPQTKTSGDDEPLTLAQERALKVRPYFVHVLPSQFLGGRKIIVDGESIITQFRYMEVAEVEDGEYGAKQELRVWVWTREEIQLHVMEDQDGDENEGKFVLRSVAPNTLGKVPVTHFYTRKTKDGLGAPPMQGLAEKNVQHLQKDADLNSLESFAAVGIWFVNGLSTAEKEAFPKVLKGSVVIKAGSTESDMKTVEHTGSAIQILRDGVQKIEDQMLVLALQPFIEQKGGDVKAIGIATSEAKGHSRLQRWVQSQEGSWKSAWSFGAEWTGTTLQDDWAVTIFSDFMISLVAGERIERALKARVAGEIDRETFLRMYAAYGELPEGVTVEDIIARVEEETPEVGLGENLEDDEVDDDADANDDTEEGDS